MNDIGHFKVFVLYSGDVDHLHIKRIYLVSFSYIIIEDSIVHLARPKRYTYIPKQKSL
jgi:hypothetical protein